MYFRGLDLVAITNGAILHANKKIFKSEQDDKIGYIYITMAEEIIFIYL